MWSALATLYCHMYSFDVQSFDRPLETALAESRKYPPFMSFWGDVVVETA